MNLETLPSNEILKLLAEINQKTTKWSIAIFGKKTKKFLELLWYKPENIKNMISKEEITNWEKDYEEIKQVYKFENIMFEMNKKFITYCVNKITRKIKSYYSSSDFINEAYIVFKKCVWFYTNPEFKFTTYLFKSIMQMITQLVFENKTNKLNMKFGYENLDFIESKTSEDNFSQINLDTFDLDKIINESNLNKNERLALQLRFNLDRKWIHEAKKTILKTNGKCYTNFGLRTILHKALEKIKCKYINEKCNLAS